MTEGFHHRSITSTTLVVFGIMSLRSHSLFVTSAPVAQTSYRKTGISSRGGAAAARRAHNPEVVGSSPTPATKIITPRGNARSLHGNYNRIEMAPGGQSEVDPPVPIPNTEVKRLSAYDTARATGCGK